MITYSDVSFSMRGKIKPGQWAFSTQVEPWEKRQWIEGGQTCYQSVLDHAHWFHFTEIEVITDADQPEWLDTHGIKVTWRNVDPE